MRARNRKAIRRGVILLALAALAASIPALVQSGSEAAAAPAAPGVVDTETINLCADEGTINLPSLAGVPIWGFSLDSGGCGGPATLPGPVLSVDVGDRVVVNLANYLDEPVSIVFPGQALVPDAVGAPPNVGTGLVAALAATSLSGGSDVPAVAASLTTALPGDSSDVTYTADTAGLAGNGITVEYVDPGAPSSLAVTVIGTAITVSLATDGSAISSTANDVVAAVNADVNAALLVNAALAPGETSYTFTASNPGTFLYEAGTNTAVQVAMGLYGALVVRPLTPGQAYGATTTYDKEKILVLSEIDPNLNNYPALLGGPNAFDFVGDSGDYQAGYHPTYFLINGQAYPDVPDFLVDVNDRVLLRYLNAGLMNHTMTLLGSHQRVIAQDAYLMANPFNAVAETIPSGSTLDTISGLFHVNSGDRLPLYNRQLNVTNDGLYPGGMMIFLDVQ